MPAFCTVLHEVRAEQAFEKGAIIVDESGGHHVSYSAIDREARKDAEYAKQQLPLGKPIQAR